MFSHNAELLGIDPGQHQIWHGAAAAAGLLTAAALLDAAPGIIERIQHSRSEADKQIQPAVFESKANTNRAVLVYAGFDQNCAEEGQKGAKVFGEMAHVIAPVYGKHVISEETTAKQTISACKDLGVEEIVLFCNSMGLGIALRAAHQPLFRQHFPQARAVIGNAGAVQHTNIAPASRAALRAIKAMRYSTTANRAYKEVYKLSRQPLTIAGHQLKIPKVPVMPPRELGRYAHAITSHLPNACLQGFVEPENVWLIDNLPGEEFQDPRIITSQTQKDVARVLGHSPQIIHDPQRPARSHEASFRYTKILKQLVERSFYPDFRPEEAV